MPLPRRFSPCYTKGNNTAGKYRYPNARNVMAIYYTNSNYISPQKMPYDYEYCRATTTCQPLDTPDEPKPWTSSNEVISGQPYEEMWNDT
jgi:hypothetical protein